MLRSRFIAIVTVAMLAQLALVGCAARPLESHVAAWDLVEEPAAIAEVAQSQDSESAVESPWGKPRVAV